MADFTTVPDFVLEEEAKFSTLVSQYENGYEQRRNKWANPLREWTLNFKNRTATELATVRDFFLAKKGIYTTFTWVNPLDSVEYTVRFREDSLKYTYKSYGIYDFSFNFVQVKA
jgi:phage-related protein